ncbi:hypothetical protein CMI49_01620 [Candidatus Pacearchaeota archaeon]|jgi:hypothetical protein|nr:hypothetical protein [Candidatus Pacearchaeota archaeon]|tara:strand:+ start:8305 stop:8694 length:390 start_codon:yes stop_codon:yes gene_type:complete
MMKKTILITLLTGLVSLIGVNSYPKEENNLMPNLSKLEITSREQGYCKDIPITLKAYTLKEKLVGLSASRFLEKNPYAVLFMDGRLYVDKNEDLISEKNFDLSNYDRDICEDVPIKYESNTLAWFRFKR